MYSNFAQRDYAKWDIYVFKIRLRTYTDTTYFAEQEHATPMDKSNTDTHFAPTNAEHCTPHYLLLISSIAPSKRHDLHRIE